MNEFYSFLDENYSSERSVCSNVTDFSEAPCYFQLCFDFIPKKRQKMPSLWCSSISYVSSKHSKILSRKAFFMLRFWGVPYHRITDCLWFRVRNHCWDSQTKFLRLEECATYIQHGETFGEHDIGIHCDQLLVHNLIQNVDKRATAILTSCLFVLTFS